MLSETLLHLPAPCLDMSSSNGDDPHHPPRKRSRTSPSGDDGAKKTRGRPRVEGQEDNYADVSAAGCLHRCDSDGRALQRRRTQIRLAQRAYRQRKETAISTLGNRVQALQTVIHEMDDLFQRYNSLVAQSGILELNAAVAGELRSVSENFAKLARLADCDDTPDAESSQAQPGTDPTVEPNNSPVAATSSSVDAKPQLDSRSPPRVHVGWGYPAHTSQSPEPLASATAKLPGYSAGPSALALVKTHASEAPFGFHVNDMPFIDGMSAFAANSPFMYKQPSKFTPPPSRMSSPALQLVDSGLMSTRTLPLPGANPFAESTFARRLTRAAVEASLRLLDSGDASPSYLNRLFKLCLPFTSMDGLRSKLLRTLRDGSKECLEDWTAPYIHVGGAGTHYPQRDESGIIIPRPNSWTVKSIGPQRRVLFQSVYDPTDHRELEIDMTGLEGEWYDANDVQGYLEMEKGLQLDPQGSFGQIFVDDGTDYAQLTATSGLNDPNSPSVLSARASRRHNSAVQTQPLTPPTSITYPDSATVHQAVPLCASLDTSPTGYRQLQDPQSMALMRQMLQSDLAAYDAALDSLGVDPNYPSAQVNALPVMSQQTKRCVVVDVAKVIGGT